MCSAILCETRWSQDPEGSLMSSRESEASQPTQKDTKGLTEDVRMNNGDNRFDDVLKDELKKPNNLPIPPQHVTRQDSGVPEDLSSPCTNKMSNQNEDDPDDTINSDCNVTVIHVSETLAESKDNKDGSDSGVEGCTVETAQANDYAGSCNGLDEVSCDSSLVSCCSVYEDPCTTFPDDLGLTLSVGNNSDHGASSRTLGRANGEATSEGGSESSSVAGSTSAKAIWATPKRPQTSNTGSMSTCKKKIIRMDSTPKSSRGRPSAPGDASHRLPSTTRSKSRTPAPRSTSSKSSTSARDKNKPRDKSSIRDGTDSNSKDLSNAKPWASQTSARSRTRNRPTPDSLSLSTSALAKEIDKDLAQRGRGTISNLSRCPSSASQKRTTPGSTPLDECRKPLPSCAKVSKTMTRSVHDVKKSLDMKNIDTKALDTYATMPRRNKARMSVSLKPEELKKQLSRDGSISRVDKSKKRIDSRESTLVQKSMQHCARSKHSERTIIYHEMSVQTGLTGEDIEGAMAGLLTKIYGPEIPDKVDNDCQTEATLIPVEDLKSVQDKVKKITAEIEKLQVEKEKLETTLITTEQMLAEERSDHQFAKQELQNNTQRILAILGTQASEHSKGSDSLLELESHFQESGQVVANQQLEIADLQSLCRILNRDLEKSLAAQKSLLQHQQEVEAETMELQEFLQLEKTAMSEAMKEVEVDLKEKEELLAVKTKELETKTEESKHLVRISEQRRQENLALEMKLNAFERKSKELLSTQGAAVSSAGVALSGLGSRLEALVEQLVKSYNISEKDLEDVVYHNEAYSRSNSSGESSPVSSKQYSLKDCSPSPKQNSFVSAVIGAIRSAATHPFVLRPTAKKSAEASKQQLFKELSIESSADLLDFETEPCLMMESVLEDVPLPDTYSRNMVSSSDSLRRVLSVPEPITEDTSTLCRNDECSSLTNLTQAILNRRRVEENENDVDDDDECESISESEATGHTDVTVPTADYCNAVNLVDQVIDVDNFVTKLLKVLRIIQLDNDTCIRELRDEKCELEGKLAIETNELNELKKISQIDLNSLCHNDKNNSNNCRSINENEIISS